MLIPKVTRPKPATILPEKPKREPSKKKGHPKLPSDSYEPEFEDIRIPVDDSYQLNIQVRRAGEFGLPNVDVRVYQTTDLYTGYTKKAIYFPVDFLPDFIAALQETLERSKSADLI